MAKKQTTPQRKTTRRAPAPAAKSKTPAAKKPVAKVAPKPARKPIAKAKAPVAAGKPAKPVKLGKTKMSKPELLHYRTLLLVKRAELIGDIDGMADSALRGKDTSNLSTMPLHMADVGSDNYDQDLMLGLMESERKLLREIDDALHRIAEGTFGVCQATGKLINKARLEAKPWAKYCIEAARELERNGNGNGNGNGR
ncbi:MAG: TraR/DksA family transcriptional regulator [Phycisphaerales bacterium]